MSHCGRATLRRRCAAAWSPAGRLRVDQHAGALSQPAAAARGSAGRRRRAPPGRARRGAAGDAAGAGRRAADRRAPARRLDARRSSTSAGSRRWPTRSARRSRCASMRRWRSAPALACRCGAVARALEVQRFDPRWAARPACRRCGRCNRPAAARRCAARSTIDGARRRSAPRRWRRAIVRCGARWAMRSGARSAPRPAAARPRAVDPWYRAASAQTPHALAMNARKTAIVTGSATGVGAATALLLAQRGYNVVINYSRSEAEAQATEAACRAAGADTLLLHGDVAEDADCRALVEAACERWRRLDALVNNAGITTFGGAANWDALDAEVFQRIVGVNAMGTFQMVRACAPHLKAARGAIVNVSSVAGALGIGSSMPYIASKGAMNSMTLYLARALAPRHARQRRVPGPDHLALVRRRHRARRRSRRARPPTRRPRRCDRAAAPRTWPMRSSGWSMARAPSPASCCCSTRGGISAPRRRCRADTGDRHDHAGLRRLACEGCALRTRLAFVLRVPRPRHQGGDRRAAWWRT